MELQQTHKSTVGSAWEELLRLRAGPASATGSPASPSVLTFLSFFTLSLSVFSSLLFTSSLVSCTWSWPILSDSSFSSCISSTELWEESFGWAALLLCSSVKVRVSHLNCSKYLSFYSTKHQQMKWMSFIQSAWREGSESFHVITMKIREGR